MRMLFDYLVVGQVLAHNPADAVRGPWLVIRTGKTPVLQEEEPRLLLDSIANKDLVDLRDRALLSVMLYSFSCVGAVVGLKVRDYEHQRRRAYLAPREKGGQHRRVPVHSRAAVSQGFRTRRGAEGPALPVVSRQDGPPHRQGPLRPLGSSRRQAARHGRRVGRRRRLPLLPSHGITNYLLNGGTLERAAAIAGHASTRTIQLYDRRRELVEPDEIERVKF